jgi:succinate-semialdehyde dehydrogenase / glutarate-semialdehyde dehydrogenase
MHPGIPPELFRTQSFIDGNWVSSRSGKTTTILNPADQQVVGVVPDMIDADFVDAIDAAHSALPQWKFSIASERARLLKRWHAEILSHKEPLAKIITLEQGKPLREAKAEVEYAASFVEWFAEEARRLNGEVLPPYQGSKRMMVLRQAVGVVATITPWNFPAAMITRKLAPAFAAGCTTVCKPAPQTPFTALALAELAERAGFPPGVINVVTTTNAESFGQHVTSDQRVAKISFTGSTGVGKKLLSQCASGVKRVSLELGGNAPFIVFDDADMDDAIEGAMLSKFRNAGQTCICANRFLVHRRLSQEFANRLALAASSLTVGNGMHVNTDVGPLINEAAVLKVIRHVFEAREQGATLVCGGARHQLGGTYFQPTVLVGVQPGMSIAREETFGPVAPILEFQTDEEAIQLANDSRAGLAAYFYTKSIDRFWRVSESLEYGMVGHNTGQISTEIAPFGGVKESGLGREGSHHGILEYTELKYVCSEIKRDDN